MRAVRLKNRRAWTAALVVVAASAVCAQDIWVGGRFSRMRPRFASAPDFDGSFQYCRAFYTSFSRGRGGGGWQTDYPGADNNFSVRLAELTRVHIKLDETRQPHHVVVPLNDPLLTRCPMVFMTDIETAQFTPPEVEGLRDFLLKGGFLWVDDSWGSRAWANWVRQIGRVLPPDEYPLVDIQRSHPIMRTLYDVPNIPQVPNISFWSRWGGETSERGPDSAQVYFKGIHDAQGNLMVLISHNTDISDTWEREGEEPRSFFDTFSPRGYAIGVNVVVYAMSH
jgi:uncharacterized protein DUF4159